MKIHDLKTWDEYFDEVEKGNKTFELRKNDRNFQVGDTLNLLSYDPKSDNYTGKVITKKISYILDGGAFGLELGYVILGLHNNTDQEHLKYLNERIEQVKRDAEEYRKEDERYSWEVCQDELRVLDDIRLLVLSHERD